MPLDLQVVVVVLILAPLRVGCQGPPAVALFVLIARTHDSRHSTRTRLKERLLPKYT